MTPQDIVADIKSSQNPFEDFESHLKNIPEEAAALKGVLDTERVKSIVEAFKTNDTHAQKASWKYKAVGTCLVIVSTLAVLLGGTYLLYGAIPDYLPNINTDYILYAQFVSVAATVFYVFRMRDGRLLEDWLQSRAIAERKRTEYFETVCGMRDDLDPERVITPPSEQPQLSFVFEYFCRFQFNEQLEYYRRRAVQHKRAANSVAVLVSVSAAVAAILLALSNLLNDVELEVYAFAALTLPICYQAHETLKLFYGNRRNSVRYQVTAERLESMAAVVPGLRRKLERDNDALSLRLFIERFHAIISLEHREWLRVPIEERIISGGLTNVDV